MIDSEMKVVPGDELAVDERMRHCVSSIVEAVDLVQEVLFAS